ncbi:Hypothetical protein CINCED_3A023115 [Cinara cedri]|uniref:Uncharacterized protein n=1 Tax=Cinara cedri TaxID=506608 RepID=A0A5E4N4T5_9HEMI|nr:Hypothetical protein CINCED_3A023115 [Cinara cedri]
MGLPSHKDIAENEKSDEYANFATKNLLNPTIDIIPISDIKNSIKKKNLFILEKSLDLNTYIIQTKKKKKEQSKNSIPHPISTDVKTLQSPALESDTPFSHSHTE